MSVTTAALIWSAVAKIEQVVGAQGQLKPQGKVQEVQAPVNGVVQEVNKTKLWASPGTDRLK